MAGEPSKRSADDADLRNEAIERGRRRMAIGPCGADQLADAILSWHQRGWMVRRPRMAVAPAHA